MANRNTRGHSRALTLFRDQAGVITRAQLLTLDISDRQISNRLRSGEWNQVRKGLYHHALFPVGDAMKTHALTLGGRGYVSHRHAGHVHNFDPDLMRRPEVTVRQGSHVRFNGVIIHESTQVDSANIVLISGLPVSGPERTIMDIAAVTPKQWELLAIIDSARESGTTDLAKLHQCLARHARQGRDGTVRFRKALEAIAPMELPAASPFSRHVAEAIHARGVPYPILEESVRDGNGRLIARVDLSWPRRLVVFLDGFTYHDKRRRQSSIDREKRHILRTMGYTVLEFTYDQWMRNPAFVLREITQAFYHAKAA